MPVKGKMALCEGIKRFLRGDVWDNEVSLHPHSHFTSMKFKHLKTIVIILLNILLCAIMLWFYVRNSYLRPFSGSFLKEVISGLLLLGSLYFNHFLLCPLIYKKNSYFIYWLLVTLMAIVIGGVDLAMAYSYIKSHNVALIECFGHFKFFSKVLFFTIGRNLALNFFPYLFRERQHLRHSLEKEREIVYERVRMLDVTDKDSNIHLVSIDEIFYCQQQRNFTMVYTVQNKSYTRLGSMKHLEQLFGEEEFIRITTTLLVPFRYIQSCQDNVVVMKKMPWEKEPTSFQLEPKPSAEISERISEFISQKNIVAGEEEVSETPVMPAAKRKTATPPDEKIQEVLSYIGKHPNCNSTDIVGGTSYSLSTVERCLSELRKQDSSSTPAARRAAATARYIEFIKFTKLQVHQVVEPHG